MNNKNINVYGMFKDGVILIDTTTTEHKFYKQIWSKEKELILKEEIKFNFFF